MSTPRCLKRKVSAAVYRHLVEDAKMAVERGPGFDRSRGGLDAIEASADGVCGQRGDSRPAGWVREFLPRWHAERRRVDARTGCEYPVGVDASDLRGCLDPLDV